MAPTQCLVPETMRALALSAYGKPSSYGIGTVPVPQITQPDEVLIKVHAAGVNPIDVNFADGMVKMASKDTFPYLLGYDAAGVIAAVGSSVTTLKVGDAVFTRVPDMYRGTIAEYCLSTASTTALKPTSLSFVDAAAIPLAGLTALQSIRRAVAATKGGLEGKTVLIPGGLSGTGSFAVQLARNVFGAAKVITTLSPGKIPRAKELLAEGKGEVKYVDYTKEDMNTAVGERQVDFMFDTMTNAMESLSLIRPGGVIVTVSKMPTGDAMRTRLESTPWILVVVLNLLDWVNRWRASRQGVNYSYMWMEPDGKGLEDLGKWVEEGKVKLVVGRKAKLEDLKGVREGCEEIYKGKGGLGKFVIEII